MGAVARTIAVFFLLPVFASETAVAQDSGSLKFEVASVKRAVGDDDAPSFMRGGPGTSDPERITYERQFLPRLLNAAYGFDFDQMSGPAWLGKELYSVDAKVSRGTTKDQLKIMWQNLLAERFHLKTHIVQKDFPVYELSVAKGGPKLRNSGEGPVKLDPGFPLPRPGENWAISRVPPRNVRQTFRNYSMMEFIQQLGWPLSTMAGVGGVALGRVVDKTGLAGRYDFTLEFAGYRGPGGAFPMPLPDGQADTAPTLIDALQQQLGLVLREKKAPLDVLVVDYADRVPTEN